VLPASCWQSEPTQRSQIFRQDAGSTLLRPPPFDCRQNIRHDFAPGFHADRVSANYDKKNIVILDGPEEE
jgi:hypothetical protein